jgi:hypothetical protein
MSNQNGRAKAMTVFTPIRPGMVLLSRLVSLWNRNVPAMGRPLRKLSFIHFAWWGFVHAIPYNGLPQRPENLRYTYLFFETNYNGEFDDYIDAFSYVIPIQMWLAWGSAFGFPGPRPVTRFKRYIRYNEFPVDHYYVAYPEASATMVQSALRLDRRIETFRQETVDLDPAQFAAAYRRFVRDNQRDL